MNEPEVQVDIIRDDSSRLPEAARLLAEFLGVEVVSGFEGLLARYVASGSYEVLLAREAARCCGVLTLSYRPALSVGGELAALEDLYVEPEHRRRGVGAVLVRAAHDRLRKRSVSYVEVQISGMGAVGFYESLGYEVESGVRVLSSSLPLGGGVADPG